MAAPFLFQSDHSPFLGLPALYFFLVLDVVDTMRCLCIQWISLEIKRPLRRETYGERPVIDQIRGGRILLHVTDVLATFLSNDEYLSLPAL